jgi:hypothetical protein
VPTGEGRSRVVITDPVSVHSQGLGARFHPGPGDRCRYGSLPNLSARRRKT